MSTALLDVNVLVALFDAAHVNHEEAHDWLASHGRRKWATCPLTIHGCIRVLSGVGYPRVAASAAEVASRLRTFCEKPGHEFWPDDISLLDEARFRAAKIAGPQQMTDVYLLGLAVARDGQLVTFGRSIPLAAVAGANSSHLRILGGAV